MKKLSKGGGSPPTKQNAEVQQADDGAAERRPGIPTQPTRMSFGFRCPWGNPVLSAPSLPPYSLRWGAPLVPPLTACVCIPYTRTPPVPPLTAWGCAWSRSWRNISSFAEYCLEATTRGSTCGGPCSVMSDKQGMHAIQAHAAPETPFHSHSSQKAPPPLACMHVHGFPSLCRPVRSQRAPAKLPGP